MALEPKTEDLTRFATLHLNRWATSLLAIAGKLLVKVVQKRSVENFLEMVLKLKPKSDIPSSATCHSPTISDVLLIRKNLCKSCEPVRFSCSVLWAHNRHKKDRSAPPMCTGRSLRSSRNLYWWCPANHYNSIHPPR